MGLALAVASHQLPRVVARMLRSRFCRYRDVGHALWRVYCLATVMALDFQFALILIWVFFAEMYYSVTWLGKVGRAWTVTQPWKGRCGVVLVRCRLAFKCGRVKLPTLQR